MIYERDVLIGSPFMAFQVPGHVFLLGSTLAESSPVQQRGPLRVMQAWAPATLDWQRL